MAITKILKDNVTGKTYTFNFEKEPSSQDLNEALSYVQSLPETNYDQGQQQPQPTKKNIVKRIGEDWGKRGERMISNRDRYSNWVPKSKFTPLIKAPEYVLQQAGELAGGIGDVGGELMASGIKVGSKLIPQIVKEKVKPVTTAIGTIAQPVVSNISERWKAFESKYPDLAEDVRSIGNIATLAPVGKIIGGPMKGAATKIQSSVLVKGNKAILKKEKKLGEDIAKTALEKKVGGNLNDIINKTQNVFDKIENKIDESIAKASKLNPGANIDIDNVMLRVLDRIEKGDKNLFGSTEEALNAGKYWVDELNRFKYDGLQPLDKVQDIKRLFGKKGFKRGTSPDINTAAKENVADIINLELKDELEHAVRGIKDLNEIYKELLPIHNMAKNRILTAQGNDMFGLGAMSSAGVGGVVGLAAQGVTPEALIFPALGYLGYQATKSGKVAQKMYTVGKNISKPTTTIPIFMGARGALINERDKSSVPLSEIARPRKR